MIPLHVLAGLAALTAGTLALAAGKGGRLHRWAGTVFVYAMMLMASIGAVVGALRSQPINVVAGSLTFYLVTTALLSVRRPRWAFARIDLVAASFAVLLGVASFVATLAGLVKPAALAAPVLVFGTIALIAGVADFRSMGRRLIGRQRVARHLWRMGLAFWIATASFFLGQAKVFPEAVRSSGLLPIPVVAVLIVMVYWVVRVVFMKKRAGWEPAIPGGRAATGRQ